jgi:uncharacterized iron-regulated membrane protein
MLTCAGSVSGFILWRKRKPESVLGAPSPIPARSGDHYRVGNFFAALGDFTHRVFGD